MSGDGSSAAHHGPTAGTGENPQPFGFGTSSYLLQSCEPYTRLEVHLSAPSPLAKPELEELVGACDAQERG